MSKMDEHFKAIREKVAKQLDELGILSQLPSQALIKIIVDAGFEYFEEEDEKEENAEHGSLNARSLAEAALHTELANDATLPKEALKLIATPKEGGFITLAIANPKEGILYFNGHKISIEGEKVVSRHMDGSLCNIGCHQCHEEADVRLRELDGEAYAWCDRCGYMTGICPTRFIAIGSWLVGQSRPTRED